MSFSTGRASNTNPKRKRGPPISRPFNLRSSLTLRVSVFDHHDRPVRRLLWGRDGDSGRGLDAPWHRDYFFPAPTAAFKRSRTSSTVRPSTRNFFSREPAPLSSVICEALHPNTEVNTPA